MPKYNVTVEFTQRVTRTINNLYAKDAALAEEKAVEIVENWDGVVEAEAVDCEEQ